MCAQTGQKVACLEDGSVTRDAERTARYSQNEVSTLRYMLGCSQDVELQQLVHGPTEPHCNLSTWITLVGIDCLPRQSARLHEECPSTHRECHCSCLTASLCRVCSFGSGLHTVLPQANLYLQAPGAPPVTVLHLLLLLELLDTEGDTKLIALLSLQQVLMVLQVATVIMMMTMVLLIPRIATACATMSAMVVASMHQ